MKINISKNYGSHLPVLMEVMRRTEGDVLELGTGLMSTPFLHWSCFDKKRRLVSVDNHEYIKFMASFRDDFHELLPVNSFDDVDFSSHEWDVVLVDQAPAISRREHIKHLANWAKYIVVHDTEPRVEKDYQYNEIYPLFKYRFDYTKARPNTTVLSNFVDLSDFEI